MKITINNWEKHNPKRAQKSYTWLRLNNNIANDKKLFGLDAEQKYLWICLLCEASRDNTDTLDFELEYLAHLSDVGVEKVSTTLDVFSKRGLTTIHYTVKSRLKKVTTPTRRTDGRDETNETDGRDETGDSLNPETLRVFWNANCASLPKAKELSDSRRVSARGQIKKYPDEKHWAETIKKLTSSKFCVEQWKPGFDDFLDESKRLKALEGKYDDKGGLPHGATFAQKRQSANLALLAKVEAGEA